VQAVLTAIVVAFAGLALRRQWVAVDRTAPVLNLDPTWVIASCLLVFATYALLIETWRRTLGAWGSTVGFLDAARVWSVSNLGKYVPGKVWQVSAMAVMMQRLGIPLPVSGAAAVVVTIANLAAGFAIVCVFGSDATVGSRATYLLTTALLALSVVALVAAPALTPRLARGASRLAGRPLPEVSVPGAAPWISTGGCFVAWLGYGLAFWVFSVGVVGHAPGAIGAYIAVFTASYLLGYLALFAPGGIGVRELALVTALPALGLATPAEAALLTLTSRLWLTILEVIPGLIFLAVGRGSRRE
jgi:hypothetical protein